MSSREENTREETAEASGTDKTMTFSGDKPLSRILSRSNSRPSDSKQKPNDAAEKSSSRNSNGKEKKPSLWSWKRLKALTTNHRTRRFNCCFSLQVHSIHGLPPFFDDLHLIVHWKRKDAELMTCPVQVYRGVAEFKEQSAYSCSVHANRSGPDNSAKYEAKHFLLYASVYNVPNLDLGSHRVDLTRLLPIMLDDLEEKGTGNWTTSFKLTGEGMGAKMNVSFGYTVVGNNGVKSLGNNVPEILTLGERDDKTEKFMRQMSWGNDGMIRRTESLPSKITISNQTPENVKELYEILPIKRSEVSESVKVLYQKLDEEISNTLINPRGLKSVKPQHDGEKSLETEEDIKEFSTIEKGIQVVTKMEVKLEDDPARGNQALAEVVALAVLHNKDVLIHPTPEETNVVQNDEQSISIRKEKKDNMCSKESIMKELETTLSNASDLIKGLDSHEDEGNCNSDDYSHHGGVSSQEYEGEALHHEHSLDIPSSCRDVKKGKSFSMNDISSMARDFLDMPEIDYGSFMSSSESEPESPRERLLWEFEKDASANGGLLNIYVENDPMDLVSNTAICAPIPNDFHGPSVFEDLSNTATCPPIPDDFHGPSMFEDLSITAMCPPIPNDFHGPSVFEDLTKIPKVRANTSRIQTSASKLEDMEAKALMQDWGLNEAAFQHSPPSNQCGYDSGIDIPAEDQQQLPSLTDGWGPCLQIKNGGLLRSMNPALFRNSKNGGTLVVQVSRPVVVPAEMGPGVIDILRCLAAMGTEKLSMQANKLMPLEDITGKSIQEIAWENVPSVEVHQRQGLWQPICKATPNMPNELKRDKVSTSCLSDSDTKYLSLDELAPLAMDKIEALSIEGLKIQSGMSDQDAPSNINTRSVTEIVDQKTKTGSVGLVSTDSTSGLQLLDIKDNREDVDGLMALSLTLDEWMKLDSGEIDYHYDALSSTTSKLLAAHHASSLELFQKERGRGRRHGLLGNNLTFAFMVQLHDPHRNYEPVGTPMLALIHVERVLIPPKHKIFTTVPQSGSSDEEEDDPKAARNSTIDKTLEEQTPEYKISEVHVASLKTLPGKKKLWGSKNQHKSGYRWLLANGMGKKYKHPLMKSRPVVRPSRQPVSTISTTVQQAPPGDLVWSITSRVFGTGDIWTELIPHIWNSNVIIPD